MRTCVSKHLCRLEKGAAGFRYLNQASSSAEPCYTLKDVDDGEGLRSTLDAMAIVGIAEAEREAVLRTVAAVLHLGNVTFASAPDEGSALSSRSAQEALAACADLLQVCACLSSHAGCYQLLLLAYSCGTLAPARPVLQNMPV